VLDSLNLLIKLGLCVIAQYFFVHFVPRLHTERVPERVIAGILPWIDIENFFEYLQIVWNLEAVSRIFVAKKIVDPSVA